MDKKYKKAGTSIKAK